MAISRLEKKLQLWKEELRAFPNKTEINQKDIKRLENAIDKWYDMQHKAQKHVDKFEEWITKL